jgi:hypothetical protein
LPPPASPRQRLRAGSSAGSLSPPAPPGGGRLAGGRLQSGARADRSWPGTASPVGGAVDVCARRAAGCAVTAAGPGRRASARWFHRCRSCALGPAPVSRPPGSGEPALARRRPGSAAGSAFRRFDSQASEIAFTRRRPAIKADAGTFSTLPALPGRRQPFCSRLVTSAVVNCRPS